MDAKLARFLDDEGKLKQLPAKQSVRGLAYEYLAGKFEYDKDYSETDVNGILSFWHTFGDYFTLRRGLIESGWMLRLPDGSRYWKNKEKQPDDSPSE